MRDTENQSEGSSKNEKATTRFIHPFIQPLLGTHYGITEFGLGIYKDKFMYKVLQNADGVVPLFISSDFRDFSNPTTPQSPRGPM